MPLVTTPKAESVNSNTPSRVISRPEVAVARPNGSTARAEALKARLMSAPPAQPVAPRPTRSSARAEELGKLNKFSTPAPGRAPQQQKPVSRQSQVPLDAIEPPPSGLAAGSKEVVQTNNIIEAQPNPEVTGEPLSPQAASLARKEMQFRKAQLEFKAKEEAWKQDQVNYIRKDRIQSETLKVLSEAGIDADKLVELQINQAQPKDPNQALHDQIAELKAQIQGIIDPEKGTLAKRDQEAYDQTVSQIRYDAKLLVDSNPAFGTIKTENQLSEVVDLITKTFEQDGEILDVEEACQLIENGLRKRLDTQYERLSRYEWLKSKEGKQAELEEATPAQLTQPSAPQRVTHTLTNAGAATRQMSARDRAILVVQERMNNLKR